ncbi:MAG: tetratricopeptide repeat protein [Pseudomonadota bacterium]
MMTKAVSKRMWLAIGAAALHACSADTTAREVVTACDTMAAAIFDPNTVTDPVPWEDLDASAALAACAADLKTYPDATRLKLLKARALLKLKKNTEAVALLEELDAQSYAAASYLLGNQRVQGKILKKDISQGYALLRRAAEGGIGYAAETISTLYFNGTAETPQSDEDALIWAQRAVEAGAGHFALGFLYDNGRGVEASAPKAIEYYEIAAERGDQRGLEALGAVYYNGRGIPAEPAKGVQYFSDAFETYKSPFAAYWLGLAHETGKGQTKSAQKAAEYYLAAVEQNNADAMTRLAVLIFNTKALPFTDEDAVSWLKKASTLKNASGMYNLGWAYANGRGVKKSASKSRRWFRKAAEAGSAAGQEVVGINYYKGNGVRQDYKEARVWLEKAADANRPKAAYWFAYMHETGKGGKIDMQKASDYYVIAAKTKFKDSLERARKTTDLAIKELDEKTALLDKGWTKCGFRICSLLGSKFVYLTSDKVYWYYADGRVVPKDRVPDIGKQLRERNQ